MGYFTAQELTDTFRRKRHDLESLNDRDLRGMGVGCLPFIEENEGYLRTEYSFNDEPIRFEDVEAWLEDFHTSIIEGNFADWKAFRPWKVVDTYKDLPADKAWIGWEIETGWHSRNSRSCVIQDTFSAYNHVCTDEEGPAYGVELTWCPKAEGYWEEESLTHPLLFVADLAQHYDYYVHEPDDHVGTHINISTPTSRTLTETALYFVVSALNTCVSALSWEEREEFFGRSDLYGGFFPQDHDDMRWIEGKLFNSTYSSHEAMRYISVGDRLATVVEALSIALKDWKEGEPFLYGTTCTNFVNVLRNGDAPEVVVREGKVYMDGDDIYCRPDASYDGYDPDWGEDDDDYDDGSVWCEECQECH